MQILPLSQMLTELRHEARLSANAAHGAHLTERYIALLRATQEEIYDEYDWPQLRGYETVTVPAGQRYTAYPADTVFEGILGVWARVSASETWVPLDYGIAPEQMNVYDSDADERAEDTCRWQNYLSPGAEVVNTNMFEIWPVPLTQVEIRFYRKAKLRDLNQVNSPETDYSTIDGRLIVLRAAAQLLAGKKSEDAPVVLSRANQRFSNIRRAQNSTSSKTVSLGWGTPKHRGVRVQRLDSS
ncbi:MAG: hypothetical protein AAGK37_19210 [Pseudomonadota bacterium]